MQDNSYASMIFPVIQPIPQILGAPQMREEALSLIQRNPATYAAYCALPEPAREAFLGFCMGNRGLKVTYDPFFQYIFNPDTRPGRLERLLSCILKQKVKVKKVLPRESMRLSEQGSLVIMDILVELADGKRVTIEMQRIGYEFPIERGFCYGADLLMRQYEEVRKMRGKKFSYRDIKPVYIIVLMEESPGIFHQHPNQYIHRSRFLFNTGLKLEPSENFIYIPLDIFKGMHHNKLTELHAWLYFLASDSPGDILRIIEKYPFFKELYQDIVDFRYHPEELMAMYSKALSIMDRNTADYMIDELKKKVETLQGQIEESRKREKELIAHLAQYKQQGEG